MATRLKPDTPDECWHECAFCHRPRVHMSADRFIERDPYFEICDQCKSKNLQKPVHRWSTLRQQIKNQIQDERSSLTLRNDRRRKNSNIRFDRWK